jgi:hypothetical protein
METATAKMEVEKYKMEAENGKKEAENIRLQAQLEKVKMQKQMDEMEINKIGDEDIVEQLQQRIAQIEAHVAKKDAEILGKIQSVVSGFNHETQNGRC